MKSHAKFNLHGTMHNVYYWFPFVCVCGGGGGGGGNFFLRTRKKKNKEK